MKRNLITLFITSLILFTGCSVLEGEDSTYKIKYIVICENSTNITIQCTNSKGEDEKISFYGSKWEKEFEICLADYDNDVTPHIHVFNDTDMDIIITAEIYINEKLNNSSTAIGPYAEIDLEGSKLNAP